MNIVLIGAPLSGKGTQAELISKNFNITHISTGDMFQEIMKQNSPLGIEVKSYMDRCVLVPDEVTIKVLIERLQSNDCKNGVLLDGFPRTLNQARKLDEIINLDKAIYINVKLENLIQRIAGRYVCSSCKKNNTIIDKSELICKFCGGDLVKRKDDTKEIVTSRFQEFMSLTFPIVDFYKKQNKLMEVLGTDTVEQVYSLIEKELKKDKNDLLKK